MSKIAVVYWSGTGNTKAMAVAVEEGAKGKGAEVSVLEASEFTAKQAGDFTGLHSVALPWAMRYWRKASLTQCSRK